MSTNLVTQSALQSIEDGMGSRMLTRNELLSVGGWTTVTGVVVTNSNLGLEINLGQDFYIEYIKVVADVPTSYEVLFQIKSDTDSGWVTLYPTQIDDYFIASFYDIWPQASRLCRYIRIYYRNYDMTAQRFYSIFVAPKESYIGTSFDHFPVPEINDYEAAHFTVTNYSVDGLNKTVNAVLGFTGDYTTDTAVMLAGSGVTNWKDIETGASFSLPEHWRQGTFMNVQVSGNCLVLSDGQTFGTWTSPVIDMGNYDARTVLVYGSDIRRSAGEVNQVVEARGSDDGPFPRFLIHSNDSSITNEWLGYSKRLYLEPTGDEIAYSYAGEKGSYENLDFRNMPSDTSVMGHKYYPGVNNMGMVACLIPGQMKYTYDFVSDDWEDYFLFCSSYEDMSLFWANGKSVIGWHDLLPLVNPTSWCVLGSIVVPDNEHVDSWHSYVTLIRESNPYSLYVLYAYIFAGKVVSLAELFHYTTFSEEASLTTFDMCEALDVPAGVWFYTGDTFLTVKKYQDRRLIAEYEIEEAVRYICTLPSAEAGFVAITDTTVMLYKEIDGALTQVQTFTSDKFTNLSSASVDINNNVWLIDVDTNYIFRVSMESAEILYEKVVPGILGVWSHPSDGSVYAYISTDLEWPYGEVVRKIDPESDSSILICTVDGYRGTTPLDTSFCGSPKGAYSKISVADPVWGAMDGALEWSVCAVGSSAVPAGRFKQIRVSLQRDRTTDPAPTIERVMLPEPVVNYDLAPNTSANFYLQANRRFKLRRGLFYPKLKIYWSM